MLTVGQQHTGYVSGKVVDEYQMPLPFVFIYLKLKTDSTLVKTSVSDGNGSFISEAAAGNYFIEYKLMGYATRYSKPFSITPAKIDTLDTMRLSTTVTQLDVVNISPSDPFVERRADKLIVNMNGLGTGSPLVEVMNQLPGVIITADDQISLNGKSVQIYLDGRATRLSTAALAGLLKGIPSSSVQKIELIAQPSAKYEAAGNGAIINIIRKRNYKVGLNGNIYAGIGKGQFAKVNGGVNVNYKGKSFNMVLNLGYNYNNYFYNNFISSLFITQAGGVSGQFIDDTKSIRTNTDYTTSLGLDFYLSKRTTLSASIKPGLEYFDRNGETDHRKINQVGNITDRSKFISMANIFVNNNDYGLRLLYEIDTIGRELVIDLDHYRYNNVNDQDNQLINFDLQLNPVSNIPSVASQNRVYDISALKIDYSHPISKGKQLEMGIKTSYVNSDNSNFFRDAIDQKTDLFFYKESISGLYFTYASTGKKFSYRLGLRGELTLGDGQQQFDTGSFKRRYFQFFPSFHIDYKVNTNHSLNLGTNKKIERPDYENLNPLERIMSSNNLQQGNPLLNPVISYNADLWYSYKNALFFGLTYSHNLADFTSISVPLSNDIITTSPGNADYSGYATMQAIYNKKLLPWWFTSTNAILSKRSFKGEINGILVQSNGINALTAASYHSFELSKRFSLMFRMSYKSRKMEKNITTQPFTYVTAGARQQFMNKKATAQLSFVDIFKSYRNVYQQNSGSLQQLWNNQFETRMVKLDLSYNFGGSIKNTRKNSGAEEEKRRSKVIEN